MQLNAGKQRQVLLAFDKFKHSLTAVEACQIAAETVEESSIFRTGAIRPLCDGGEGFATILTSSLQGEILEGFVSGPRGEEVNARFGMVDVGKIPQRARELAQLPTRGKIGIVEMAQAAGLEKLPVAQRDPWRTTTYGVGEIISLLADRKPEAILMGIGGSATNDLGIGCLAALGLERLDQNLNKIPVLHPIAFNEIWGFSGKNLRTIPPLRIACDVTNPLLKENGATAIYGPQKGLSEEDLPKMDAALERVANLLLEAFGKPSDWLEKPGTGAAGGIGFGLSVALGAMLVPGFSLIEAWLGLPDRLVEADLVLTGEGRFDRSSLVGKGPASLAVAAAKASKPTFIFAGSIENSAVAEILRATGGLAQVIQITPGQMDLQTALQEAPKFLRKSVAKVLAEAGGA